MKKRSAYHGIEDHIAGVRAVMLGLNMRQLRRLRIKLDGLSETNCGWTTYRSKHLLIQFLDEIVAWKKSRRRTTSTQTHERTSE